MKMLITAELDMANTVAPSDIADFLTDAAWAVRHIPHGTQSLSGAAIFGRDMLFAIPFLADWNKIGENRQRQTNRNTERENKSCISGITKLVIEYFFTKKVSSTNQKANTIKILGLY
eukprot:CCRYP_016205-RA/>CCRYP_016205-RA protein AED:0.18 eAED:0.42 QI:0/-1/0/1/-1/1/1/0/116